MKFLSAVLPLFALVSVALAADKPPQSLYMGTIVTPSSNTTISTGVPFTFNYSPSNWCHEGYNTFRVFATENEPSYEDVTSDGNLPGDLYYFGEYVAANYGLPPIDTPPPSSLTLPDIGYTGPGYLGVVQMFYGCPGYIYEELGVTSVPMTIE